MTEITPSSPVADLFTGGRDASVTQALNCLRRAGYRTVGELTQATAGDLRDLRSFGAGSLAITRAALRAHGLHLAGEAAS